MLIPSKSKVVRPWWRPFKRYLLRNLPRKKRILGTWLHRILGDGLFDARLWKPSQETVARGMVVGTFMGLMPFFGLQIFLSMLICYVWRVNFTVAALATLISNPFTTPPILWLQYRLGQWIMAPWIDGDLPQPLVVQDHLLHFGKPFLVGALVSALVASLFAYPLMHALWYGLTALRRRNRRLGLRE
jgi:uncharacterized protein